MEMKKNLPNRKRNRLKEYDYSLNNFYYVTICMQNRKEFFSKIVNEKLVLSQFGKIVTDVLNNLPKYYPCELDEYVVMPDHIHAIIILNNEGDKIRISLSTVIQRFKTFTSKKINELSVDQEKFHWQKSFYDRIIRDEKELYMIRNYIRLNPLKWELDKDRPENLDI